MRSRLITLIALSAVLGLVASAPALAQTGSEGTDDEARALFEAGRVAFDQGRFANALEHFERSYELSHRPGLLYNIASSADRMRNDERALEAFEAFLEAVPDTSDRNQVEARIAVLRAAVAREAQPTTETDTDVASEPIDRTPDDEASITEPPDADGDGVGAAPWIVVGISGAALLAGVALLAVTAADYSTVEGVADGGSWADIRDAHDRASVIGPVGWVLAAVGAAGVAVGLGWALSGSSDSEVQARFGPGSVELRGRF